MERMTYLHLRSWIPVLICVSCGGRVPPPGSAISPASGGEQDVVAAGPDQVVEEDPYPCGPPVAELEDVEPSEQMVRAAAAVAPLADDPDDGVRLLAFSLLAHLGSVSVPHLVTALESGDEKRMQAACRALGEMGPRASGAVDELMGLIENRSEHERVTVTAAMMALGDMGSRAGQAAPLLASLVADPELGWTAGSALRSMGEPALQALLMGVRADDEQQAAAAREVLLDMDPAGVDDPVARVQDPDPLVRAAAASMMAQCKPVSAVRDALARALRDEEQMVRNEAWGALRVMDADALDVLVGVIKDTDEDAARTAMDLLGDLGDEGAPAIPALASLVEAGTLGNSAARTLGEIGVATEGSTGALVGALQSGGLSRYTLLAALVGTGASEHVEVSVVAPMVESGPLDVSILAAQVLGNVGPGAAEEAGAVRALLARIADESDDMAPERILEGVVAVYAALSRMGDDPADLLPQMIALLPGCGGDGCASVSCSPMVDLDEAAVSVALLDLVLAHPHPSLRCQVGRLAYRMGEDALELAPSMARVLQGAGHEVRRELLKALAAMGPDAREACPAVLEVAGSGDADFAARALETLGAMQCQSAWDTALEAYLAPDQDPGISMSALQCMQDLGPPPQKVVDELLDELDGEVSPSQARLLPVLARSGPGVIDTVLALLDSDQKKVRMEALMALWVLEAQASPATDALVQMLDDADQLFFAAIMDVLIVVTDPDLSLIDQYAARVDAKDSQTCTLALIQLTDVLMTRAGEHEDAERLEAMTPILEPHLDVLTRIAGLVSDTDLPDGQRMLATYALGAFGPMAREQVPALLASLEDPDEMLRMTTLAALGNILGDTPWSF